MYTAIATRTRKPPAVVDTLVAVLGIDSGGGGDADADGDLVSDFDPGPDPVPALNRPDENTTMNGDDD